MNAQAENFGLLWDYTIAASLSERQGWVLSAMQRYGQQLVTVLWRILGNEQDVCDAYQNTFLKLAHYQGRQKPEHVKAYIFRSASNVAISMLRKRIIERKNLSEFNCINNKKSANNDLDATFLREQLRYSIVQLPETLRNVITLHDLAELSYAQVGKILGITQATARVYRCKALQLLAVLMNR